MKTMKKMMTWTAIAGLVLALAPGAQATLISVDVSSTYDLATITSTSGDHLVGDHLDAGQNTTDDQIGVWVGAGTANWWNYASSGSKLASGLVDADGNPTSVSYQIGTTHGNLRWNSNPQDDLRDGWYGPAGFTTTISGLAADTTYDIVVYHTQEHVAELVTVNGAIGINYEGPLSNPSSTATENEYADAFDGLVESDFWYFQTDTDGDGKLVISTGGGSGADTITGFQVRTPGGGTAATPGTLIYGK